MPLRPLGILVAVGVCVAAAVGFDRPAAKPADGDGGSPVAEAPAATRGAAAATAVATFPDGSERPVLNGVDKAIVVKWPADRPYSAVTGTVRDGDTEWWKHADGSWSTTLRRLDQATGKWVTLTPVFQPVPTKPAQLRGQ